MDLPGGEGVSGRGKDAWGPDQGEPAGSGPVAARGGRGDRREAGDDQQVGMQQGKATGLRRACYSQVPRIGAKFALGRSGLSIGFEGGDRLGVRDEGWRIYSQMGRRIFTLSRSCGGQGSLARATAPLSPTRSRMPLILRAAPDKPWSPRAGMPPQQCELRKRLPSSHKASLRSRMRVLWSRHGGIGHPEGNSGPEGSRDQGAEGTTAEAG